MKRALHFCKVVFGLWLSCLSQLASAAPSPNSVSGWTFDLTITDGTPAYYSSGKFIFCVQDSGLAFRTFSVTNSNGAGTMTYTRTGPEIGRIQFVDSWSGVGFSQVLIFTSTNSGNYQLTSTNYLGYQQGLFTAYTGNAPASLAGKIIQFSVANGTAPFATNGNYRLLAFSDGSFVTEVTPGVTCSSGFGAYGKTNQSTAFYSFSDSLVNDGFFALTFATATNGIFLARTTNWTGYQQGSFSLSDFIAPTFTAHPTNRYVTVGNATTFSANATGTAPLSYQWYKDNSPIPGATSKNYTIPFVELTHAGEYWVTARNVGTPVPSARAVLTPVCGYTLTPERASFGTQGGAGEFYVAATGSCSWSANSSASWISITSPVNGNGLGTITYSVTPNTNNVARFGAIVVSGKSFIVTQLGVLAPVSVARKTFSIIATNQDGMAVTNSFLLSLSATNTFRTTDEGFTNIGNYSFARTANTTATLWLTNENGSTAVDLVFRSPSAGSYTSVENGVTQAGLFLLGGTPSDFNQDGDTTDLLLENVNRSLSAWFMKGTNFLASGPVRHGLPTATGWKAMSLGDFNVDGNADILFQHESGKIAVWFMNGTNLIGSVLLRNGQAVGAGWRIAGTADFNHDGKTDILFQHETRTSAVWFFNGTNFLSSFLLRSGVAAGAGWRIVAVNDSNDDGQPDLYWQHTDRRTAVWRMIGVNFVDAILLRGGQPTAPGWRVAGSSDFNFDGRNDLLFQHDNGKLAVWFMNGGNFLGSVQLRNGQSIGTGWNVVAPK